MKNFIKCYIGYFLCFGTTNDMSEFLSVSKLIIVLATSSCFRHPILTLSTSKSFVQKRKYLSTFHLAI